MLTMEEMFLVEVVEVLVLEVLGQMLEQDKLIH